MILGVVGSEAAKFTPDTESEAKRIITELLTLDCFTEPITGVCSGHSPLGGIDIWAEEIADNLLIPKYIFAPKEQNWENGFKPRNIQIAEKSDIVICITLKVLPDSYTGMRFKFCYHCRTDQHVKSGGCWTVKYAQKLGKPGYWIVI